MCNRIKTMKVISIILTLIFTICGIFMMIGFWSDDLNYFNKAEKGCGFFVMAVVLGILVLFVVLSAAISKIQKEIEDEKIAVANEIKELKKQIEKLQK